MATVTGEFTTAHGGDFPEASVPGIEFVPSKAAITTGGHVVTTYTETVAPDPVTRLFSVNLIPTVDVIDDGFHYTVKGFWLVPDGYDTGHGYRRVDVFEQRIYVPTEGGNIGALAIAKGRPFKAWVFVDPTWTTENQPEVVIPGAYYLSAHPTDPELGTGQLWKAVA